MRGIRSFALGPAVLCICVASACRGFFQGQGDMTPTAVSQVIEALGKLLLGLTFAWLVKRATDDLALASGASIVGISLGAAASAGYVIVKYRRNRGKVAALGGEAESYGATARKLLAIAVPITLGAAGLQLINLVDEIMVTRRLLDAARATAVGAESWMGQMLALAQQNGSAGMSLSDVMQTAVENQSGVYAPLLDDLQLPDRLLPLHHGGDHPGHYRLPDQKRRKGRDARAGFLPAPDRPDCHALHRRSAGALRADHGAARALRRQPRADGGRAAGAACADRAHQRRDHRHDGHHAGA